MADYLDQSLNASKKNLICNHCMYDCINFEHMKEHYRSEFHKYNLNRVTMNLNPLNFEEYTKKKEIYQKIHESKVKASAANVSVVLDSLKCDVCRKVFSTANKFNEHMSSRNHKKVAEAVQANPVKVNAVPKSPEEEKTTNDDVTICLFCNAKNESVETNMVHMIEAHKFEVPFIFCIKNVQGMLKLMAKKIVTYQACLTCDYQNFKNYKAVQNHMLDKQHTSVNDEDLEEFLYKFYDKKSLMSIKDRSLKRLKEYKILKIKLKMKKIKKVKKEAKEDEDGWQTASDDEETPKTPKILNQRDLQEEAYDSDSEDEYEPVTLPNGELLLENGTIVGSKIYQTYYKQRFHVNKYEKHFDGLRAIRMKTLKFKSKTPILGPKMKYWNIRDSNKSSFTRVNTLFKALKQVNV
jgi:pre-60S factor REI1